MFREYNKYLIMSNLNKMRTYVCIHVYTDVLNELYLQVKANENGLLMCILGSLSLVVTPCTRILMTNSDATMAHYYFGHHWHWQIKQNRFTHSSHTCTYVHMLSKLFSCRFLLFFPFIFFYLALPNNSFEWSDATYAIHASFVVSRNVQMSVS